MQNVMKFFDGVASLLTNNYKVAYGKGTVAMALLLSRFPLNDVQEVNSIELGIKMLARKRFDVLISPSIIFKHELSRTPVETKLYLVGTLMVLEGYPYLHKRYRHLIPALTEELRKRTPAGGLPLQ